MTINIDDNQVPIEGEVDSGAGKKRFNILKFNKEKGTVEPADGNTIDTMMSSVEVGEVPEEIIQESQRRSQIARGLALVRARGWTIIGMILGKIKAAMNNRPIFVKGDIVPKPAERYMVKKNEVVYAAIEQATVAVMAVLGVRWADVRPEHQRAIVKRIHQLANIIARQIR